MSAKFEPGTARGKDGTSDEGFGERAAGLHKRRKDPGGGQPGPKELGCGLTLDPARNLFSAKELLETRTGETPDQANGWGIMDHGVGCLEKVRVVDGRTVDVDMGQETAFVYLAGRRYRLRGDVLTEED